MAKQIKQQDFIDPAALKDVASDLHNIYEQGQLADKSLISLAKSMKELKMPQFNSKELSETESKLAAVNKMYDDKIAIDKEIIKTEQEKERLRGITERNERARAKEAERIAKNEAREAEKRRKEQKDQQSAYRQTQLRASELYQELRDLAIVGDTNSKTYRGLKLEYDRLDKSLKNVDASFGKHQRNVGNYTNVVSGLKNGLGQLGLAFSGLALARDAFSTITEFDEKLADIQKTSGLSKNEVRDLSIELASLDTRTSVTALQELASAGGRLSLETAGQIKEFAKSADMAFVALGDDLDGTAEEIATNLGKVASAFGDEQQYGIGEAITRTGSSLNELSANSKASAGAILDFTNRMAGVASVSNIAQTDIQALGALFDSSGQSIEVASTTLNTLLPALSSNYKKFAEVAGMTANEFKELVGNNPIEALKQVAVGAQSSEAGLNGLVETLEAFGIESSRGSAIVGTLANNTDELTRLQEISNKAFSENVSLQNEFNTKNETMQAGVEKLKKEWDLYVIELANSTGATNRITYAINLLAKNLPTVISLLGKLIAAFITFRTIMFSMKLAEQIKGIGGLSGAFQALTGNVNSASGSVEKFGNALRGIGWTVAIGLAFELGKALYDVASGAEEARIEQERLSKAIQRGGDNAGSTLSTLEKGRESLRKFALASGKTGKDLENTLAGIDQNYKSGIEEAIKNRTHDLELAQGRLTSFAQENEKRIRDAQVSNPLFRGAEEYGLLRDLNIKSTTVEQYREELRLLESELRNIEKANTEGKIAKATTKATKEKKKEIQDYTKAVRDLRRESIVGVEQSQSELLDKYLDTIEKIETSGIMSAEYRIELTKKFNKEFNDIQKKADQEAEKQRRAHLDRMREMQMEFFEFSVNTSVQNENLDDLREYYSDREKAYEKYAKDKEKLDLELERLDMRLNESQLKRTIEVSNKRIEAIRQIYDELLSTDNELLSDQDLQKKRELQTQIKDYETEVINAEIQLQDLRVQMMEKQLEKSKSFWKRAADYISNVIDAIQEKLNQMYDKQIENENRLIDKSKQRIDYLTQAAALGNQTATDSILAEEKRQEEAQRNIERIEKNKQRAQFITSALSMLNQKIANGDKNPVISTIAESTILNSFLRSLPSFKKGTEYFNTNGKNYDGLGGRPAMLHNGERVVPQEENLKIGVKTPNTTVGDVMLRYRIGELVPKNMLQYQPNNVDLESAMKPIVNEIRDGFSNITTTNYDVNKLVKNMLEVTKTTQRGRVTIIDKNKYRA